MKHHSRKRLRLENHDYRGPGRYVVTICTQKMDCLFGRIVHFRERLSSAGYMLRREWTCLQDRFPHVTPEELVVMPNHIHGILWFRGKTSDDRALLGQVMGAFKSLTTREYRAGVREEGWPPVEERLWLRGYYDHVIRDDADHVRAVRYILMNPGRWLSDPMRPKPGARSG